MRTAFLCVLTALSTFASAQPPLTRYSFVDTTEYALIRPEGYYLRECGHEVAKVIVRTDQGVYYTVVILKDVLEGLKPGGPVPIKREHLP